jgi:hypothetical protein
MARGIIGTCDAPLARCSALPQLPAASLPGRSARCASPHPSRPAPCRCSAASKQLDPPVFLIPPRRGAVGGDVLCPLLHAKAGKAKKEAFLRRTPILLSDSEQIFFLSQGQGDPSAPRRPMRSSRAEKLMVQGLQGQRSSSSMSRRARATRHGDTGRAAADGGRPGAPVLRLLPAPLQSGSSLHPGRTPPPLPAGAERSATESKGSEQWRWRANGRRRPVRVKGTWNCSTGTCAGPLGQLYCSLRARSPCFVFFWQRTIGTQQNWRKAYLPGLAAGAVLGSRGGPKKGLGWQRTRGRSAWVCLSEGMGLEGSLWFPD